MDRLPLFLRLSGKRCLVVGGGVVAERKVRLLLRAGADVRVRAPELNLGLNSLAAGGRIEHVPGPYARGDIDGCWLIIAAAADSAVNASVASDCEAAGRLCNVVDDNEASGFILPAIVDRSPVVIGIGTGGQAPVLAQQLKSQIEALLPSRIGELAERAGRWRGLVKKRFATMRERRRFWQRFFDGPVAERYLTGRTADAERLVRRELMGGDGQTAAPGEAWIVGAGPGDPSLVTLRAQQLIRRADVVLYDRLVSPQVIDFARKDALLIHVGKSPDSTANHQERINELLVWHVAAGRRVCRLKGGDPFVFGRGGEEVRALIEAGLPFQVVPGISAALGCAAYAGIPLTYRGVSSSVTFATAHLDGDLAPDWPGLVRSGQTLCLYMGIGTIDRVRARLLENGVVADTPVAVVERGTLPDQRVISSSVGDMAADARRSGVRAPAMIYIGEVAALAQSMGWYQGEAAAAAATSDGRSFAIAG